MGRKEDVYELDLENRCVKYAKNKGWLEFKLELTGRRGLPDRLFLKADLTIPATGYTRCFFVEFKAPGGPVRKQQNLVLSALTVKGYRAEVIDNEQDFKNLIDYHEGI